VAKEKTEIVFKNAARISTLMDIGVFVTWLRVKAGNTVAK
jgi:hypothetical protein